MLDPWILKPLSEARDRTHILTEASRNLNPLSRSRNSKSGPYLKPGPLLLIPCDGLYPENLWTGLQF